MAVTNPRICSEKKSTKCQWIQRPTHVRSAAVSSLFEVEKSALSHNLFYILALSSVNILCSVSSNAGSCLGTRGAFPVSLNAQRSDEFCILCLRLAHLVASSALTLQCQQIMCLQQCSSWGRYTVLALRSRSLPTGSKGASGCLC